MLWASMSTSCSQPPRGPFFRLPQQMFANLAKWRDVGKAAGVSKAGAKRYDSVVKPFLKDWEKAKKAYGKLSKL